MTRSDIERLLHCARTEGMGAGPNTLAEVCEWALEAGNNAGFWGRAAACNRQRAEKAEAELAQLKLGIHAGQSCQMLAARLVAAEAKLVKARNAIELALSPAAEGMLVVTVLRAALADEESKKETPCCDGCSAEWHEALRILDEKRDYPTHAPPKSGISRCPDCDDRWNAHIKDSD